MPKPKVPSPQEIYWARKQAQEAYLPPGLINHGNTCFMNSVLQGLIATRLLADLVQFNDVSEEVQEHSSALLLSRRSPQLANGHGRGGVYEKSWVDLPIGDRFIDMMHRAWRIQSGRKRENLSPKDLLGAVGRKYDQYLDFAQQDAHEFLRILLDAMRMEEQDVIKIRQPPLPKQPKKRRRSSQPPPSTTNQSLSTHTSSNTPDPTHQSQYQPLSEADTLSSFSDMIFGGKLTSILVCQKCKHISQTYEDFNDISLSLKAEDYAVIHSRKRNRFKNFAKKLAAFPSTSLVNVTTASSASATSAANPNNNQTSTNDINGVARSSRTGIKDESNTGDTSTSNINDNSLGVGGGMPSGRMGAALTIQRSSSVPPSPRDREDPQISEKMLPHLVSRRLSMEHLQSDLLVPPSNGSGSTGSGPGPGPVIDSDPLASRDAGNDRDANPDTVVAGAIVNEASGVGNGSSDPDHTRTSSSETKRTESDESKTIINGNAVLALAPPGDKHIEFAEPIRDQEKLSHGKEKKKRDDDGWSKIGRRISLTVKLGKRDKEKGKEKKAKDKEVETGNDKEKKSRRSAEKRFSGLSARSKPSSPVTSSAPTLTPGAHNSTTSAGHTSSRDDQSTPELNAQLPSPPFNSRPAIMTSVSSPGILSPPSSFITTTANDSSQSQPQPPIATPTPLRSFSSQSTHSTQQHHAHNVPRLSTPLQTIQTHMQSINTHVQAQVQKVSGIQRSRSPKPPKQTQEEQEYLRRILADVAPVPVSKRTISGGKDGTGESGAGAGGGSDVEKGAFNKTRLKSLTPHLHSPGSSNGTRSQTPEDSSMNPSASVGTWLPLAATSQFSGLEECLRMFTAVEVLDGENMVGCRRCWKIQNGYVKGMINGDGEDSDDEDDEEKGSLAPEPGVEVQEKEKKRLLAPPLQSVDSQSSTTSNTTFASAESGELGVTGGKENAVLTTTMGMTMGASQSPVPLSRSTPTLVPSIMAPPSEADIPTTTPRLPHRSSSTPIVEQADHWPDSATLVTAKASTFALPAPPKDELHHIRISTPSPPPSPALRTARPLPRTPGDLPIPRISTTPAVESSSSLNGIIAGAGVEDIFIDNPHGHPNANNDSDEGEDEATTDYGTQTPASNNSSSGSSMLLDITVEESINGGSTTDEDVRRIRKRQGMVFSDSLVVPTRSPGRLGTKPRRSRATTGSTDGDGFNEADSVASLGSVTGSEESESAEESAESAEESAEDVGLAKGRPLVPPGLGHEGSVAEGHSSTPPSLHTATTVTVASPTPAPPKPATRPKKKRETILRPAYKRYLISIPPPILVIHLKRFQQLNSSSSSALSSLAGKIAAGFSPNPGSGSSGGRSTSYGGGFGFGGIGGGGFKKLEEFVSFPEWLDLSPFLAPKKEEAGLLKNGRSHSSKQGVSRRDKTADEDGRCMYRLYAVVVHIGNMLGGHYVAYVALPDEPPLSDARVREGENAGERTKDRSEKASSDEGVNPMERHAPSGGQRAAKRQWAYISDTNVRLVSFEEVLNTRAYICMYERV